MTCAGVDDLLEAWSAGLLPPKEVLAVAGHLASCGACRAQAELAVRLLDTLQSEVPAPVPGLARGVLERLERGRRPWEFPVAAALALGALAAGWAWVPAPALPGFPLEDLAAPASALLEAAWPLALEASRTPWAWGMALAVALAALKSPGKETVHG